MSRVATRLLLAAVLVGTVLAASASSAGPGYHQPDVGSCHKMTMRQSLAMTASNSSVDCAKGHTSKTLAVTRYQRKVDWDAPNIWDGIFQPCARKANQALGGDKLRALSAYELTFFIPSKQDRSHGANWKRCDLVLVGDRTLQRVPEKLALGASPLPDRFARCLVGPDRDLRLTVCAKTHTFRATGAIRIGRATYPGENRLTRLAIRHCPERVTSETWRYSLPRHPDYWKVGWRTIVCYSKTTE